MKIFVSIQLLFICISVSEAQQSNNWLFPFENGITFNTNPPSQLRNSPFDTQSFYSCASISDYNGFLIFSTDGGRVWDKNGNVVPNGNGLFGGGGDINTALIIPFIGNSLKYHLFISQSSIGAGSDQDTCKYSYNIVDMSLNGGLGDISTKNVIIKYKAIEKMVAIPNANGHDIWWICRDWTNHFYSYRITCQGFQNSNPVISTVGVNVNDNTNQLIYGDMKASPDSKYISACYRDYFELYQFNNETGLLSNPIKIPAIQCYGVEFSTNSKLVYISQRYPQNNTSAAAITQYNISTYDSLAISNSLFKVSEIEGGVEGGLQLGPDNKIYHNAFDKFIDVINNPNIQATGCNFQDSVIILPNDIQRRFPYSYVNLITNQNVQATYTVAPDCRTVTLNAKTYIKGNNLAFNWKFGDGDSAIQNIPSGGDTTYTTIVHTYPPGVDTFFASLTLTSDTVCGQGRAGAKVVVKPPPPIAKFGFTAGNCGSTTVQFTDSSLLNFNPSLTYQWAYKRAAAAGGFINFSTASNPSFTFAAIDSFEVRLTVTSSLSCVNDNSITKRIYLTPAPVAAFTTADTCAGSLVKFTNSSTGIVTSYKWLFGNGDSSTATLPVYAYPAPGNYTIRLNIVTTNNCTASFTQPINIQPNPIAAFSITESCLGKPITLSNNSSGSIISYNWRASDGQNFAGSSPAILFNNEGNYSLQLKVQSAFGCSDSISKPVSISNVKITASSDTSILINQPLQLSVSGAANYVWQPANLLNNSSSITPVFKSAISGVYPIIVQGTTAQGCKGTATITITVYNIKAGLLLPNAFSPNGDNVNEVFRFNCTGLQSLTFFRIFNRYGQAMYEQRSCNNSQGWNGKYKGILQNLGAYIYQWQGIDFEGKILSGKGTVMLLR